MYIVKYRINDGKMIFHEECEDQQTLIKFISKINKLGYQITLVTIV